MTDELVYAALAVLIGAAASIIVGGDD